MYFKNAQIYRLSTEWPITAETLHEQLAKKPFHPCGAQDFESRGWVAPYDGGELVHAIGDNWLVCMQTEAKILPPAVINKEADARAAEIEEQQGFKLGRKAMKELRDAGAYNLAQDEASCVVFGMPREAIRQDAVHRVLPLRSIAPHLLEVLRAGALTAAGT